MIGRVTMPVETIRDRRDAGVAFVINQIISRAYETQCRGLFISK